MSACCSLAGRLFHSFGPAAAQVIMCLQTDESFLQSLFKGLADDDEEADSDCDDADTKLRRLRDTAQFLKEFCLFSQTLSPPNRDGFFKVFIFIYPLSLIDQLQCSASLIAVISKISVPLLS